MTSVDAFPNSTNDAAALERTIEESSPIPIPPIAEQHRIVAKIEQLMARCDELETLGTDRTQKRTNVHTAAIDRLLTAKADRDFKTAWNFITQHFGELYSVKENVTELRKTILQLAVMGKLVPQDPTDRPASELLKAIELEKQRLVKEGKIKSFNPLPDIKTAEVPYTIPKGWMWVRLGSITRLQNGFAFKSAEYTSHGIKLIRNVNISHGFVDHRDITYYPDSEGDKFKDFELSKGDILISLDRPIISTGLKIAIVVEQDLPSLLVQRVGRVRSSLLKVKPLFLFNWFNSSLFVDRIAPGRSNGIPHISTKEVEIMLFPLPPLLEQHRIVAKVDRLMELCDRLDQQIEAAKTKQTELLNALMAEV
jgi:type I restriction enzyme S subunit